jgi:hypothetical protein
MLGGGLDPPQAAGMGAGPNRLPTLNPLVDLLGRRQRLVGFNQTIWEYVAGVVIFHPIGIHRIDIVHKLSRFLESLIESAVACGEFSLMLMMCHA